MELLEGSCGGARGAVGVLRCWDFLPFCTCMGLAREDCRARWAQAPRLGALGHQESSPKPALQQGAQPSQGPPSLLWGNAGWREGVGSGTDVPVDKSLTPSREPSAYMKGDQPPPVLAGGGTPPRGPPKPM